MHAHVRTADSLIGRDRETHRLDELTGAARAGWGGALVLAGEAGIGKSALLGHTHEAATGFHVVRASGAEFERELPYSALHQLCAGARAPRRVARPASRRSAGRVRSVGGGTRSFPHRPRHLGPGRGGST